MQSTVKSMSPYEWLLLIILSILWGGSFFFVGVAVEALPPLTSLPLGYFWLQLLFWQLYISQAQECLLTLQYGLHSSVWAF